MVTALASMTECRLLDALQPEDEATWISALDETPHDIYHRPEFAQLDARMTNGKAVAFIFREEDRTVLIPLVLRNLPEPFASHRLFRGYRDAIGPYGYPCPIAKFGHRDSVRERSAFFRRAMQRLAEKLQSHNVVSTFLRLHPLLTDRELFADFEAESIRGEVVEHGESVYCDLTCSKEAMWQQTRRRDRSYINKLDREGYRLVLDTDWSDLDQFVDMYYATMQRVAADDYYFFPRSYFDGLRTSLGQNTHLAFIAAPDGERVCGAILTTCGDIMQYHLAGTNERFLNGNPNKLLIHQLRLWGKQHGMRAFHLGGGVGAASDSLLHFKRGFSKLRAPFASYRLVTNGAVYTLLSREWKVASKGKTEGDTRFFPSYRQTVPQDCRDQRSRLRVVRTDGSVHEPNLNTAASTHINVANRRAA